MSLKGTVERLEAEKVELLDKLSAVEAKHDETLAALENAREELKKSVEEQQATFEQMRDEHAAEIADKDAANLELEQRIEDLNQSNADITDERDQAQLAMQNPAFADAGARGEDEPADVAAESGPGVSVWDEYLAIADPVEKAIYWKENEAKLSDTAQDNFAKITKENENA